MMTTAACNAWNCEACTVYKEIIIWKGLNATVSDHGCFVLLCLVTNTTVLITSLNVFDKEFCHTMQSHCSQSNNSVVLTTIIVRSLEV